MFKITLQSSYTLRTRTTNSAAQQATTIAMPAAVSASSSRHSRRAPASRRTSNASTPSATSWPPFLPDHAYLLEDITRQQNNILELEQEINEIDVVLRTATVAIECGEYTREFLRDSFTLKESVKKARKMIKEAIKSTEEALGLRKEIVLSLELAERASKRWSGEEELRDEESQDL